MKKRGAKKPISATIQKYSAFFAPLPLKIIEIAEGLNPNRVLKHRMSSQCTHWLQRC